MKRGNPRDLFDAPASQSRNVRFGKRVRWAIAIVAFRRYTRERRYATPLRTADGGRRVLKDNESDVDDQTVAGATPVRAPWRKPEILQNLPIRETEGIGINFGDGLDNLC